MRRLLLFQYVIITIGLFSISVILGNDRFVGNYQGKYTSSSGDSGPLAAQIVPQGEGIYRVIIFVAVGAKSALEGKQEGDKLLVTGQVRSEGTYDVSGEADGSTVRGRFSGDDSGTFELQKTYKKSPSLGAKPPDGAVVLFDGSNLDAWQQANGQPPTWKILEDGSMEVREGSIVTKQEFGDVKLHVEFRTPLMAEARGQARGNSGVYIQRRYEVQVLDSFGLDAEIDGCGSLYKIAAPRVNACLPPLEWQTYDITFYGPKFDDSGVRIKDAEITVVHNEVTIHENLKIPQPTGAARGRPDAKRGPLLLQDHHNSVQFRNIWVMPLN